MPLIKPDSEIEDIMPETMQKDMEIKKKSIIAAEMTFDAAHRLSNYQGKCKRIHGHTYKVIVEVSSKDLNEWGAVMDFGDLKKIMNNHIDQRYDHKLLLYVDDPINKQIADALPDKDWVVWMNTNTTAEHIAQEIYIELKVVLRMNKAVRLERVTVYETPKNAASYEEEEI